MASAPPILLAGISGTSLASGTPEIFACGNNYEVDPTTLASIPLSVHTSWGSGPAIYPALPRYTTPGVLIESPGVPLGTPLNSIEVCGKIVPPVAGKYTIGCPGCTVRFPSGCLDKELSWSMSGPTAPLEPYGVTMSHTGGDPS